MFRHSIMAIEKPKTKATKDKVSKTKATAKAKTGKQQVKQSVVVNVNAGKSKAPRARASKPVVYSDTKRIYTEPTPTPRLNVPVVDSISQRIPLAQRDSDAVPRARVQKSEEYLETDVINKAPAFVKPKKNDRPYDVEVEAQQDLEEVNPARRGLGLSSVDVFTRPRETITGVVPTANDPTIKFQKYTQDFTDVLDLAGNTNKSVPFDEQAEGTLTKTAFQEKGEVGGFQVPVGKPGRPRKYPTDEEARRARSEQSKQSYERRKEKLRAEGIAIGYAGAKELSGFSTSETEREMTNQGFAHRRADKSAFDSAFGTEMAYDSKSNNNPVLRNIDQYMTGDAPADGTATLDPVLFE